MNELRLAAPQASGERLSARLTLDTGGSLDLYYERSDRELPNSADPFVVASLLTAMKRKSPLVVEAPVSKGLLQALPQVQAQFAGWEPKVFRAVEVRAEMYEETRPKASGRGQFFSLGLDSFHTLRNVKDSLTHLVMIKGFEAAHQGPVWDQMLHNAKRVADHYGKELVIVETNVKTFDEYGLTWEWLHGSALVSVAHALKTTLGAVYISASQRTPPPGPFGSHPDVDPLWSTETIELLHFGAVPRVKKILEIAGDPLVLDTLRVCISGNPELYNCAGCRKCIITMASLECMNKRRESTSFPATIDPEGLRKLRVIKRVHFLNIYDTIALMRATFTNPDLVAALKRRVRVSKLRLAFTNPLWRVYKRV